jgi:hypothetical protein
VSSTEQVLAWISEGRGTSLPPPSPPPKDEPSAELISELLNAELRSTDWQSQLLLDDARAELVAIQTELQRRRYANDWLLWADERLRVFLWSAQKRILRSVQEHRKTAVQSCHGVGKSFIASTAICAFIDTSPPGEAFVVTSAPTGPQVKAILWREINRAVGSAGLPGRTNLTEWYLLNPRSGKEELVAFGRKPADMDPGAFQGIHAQRVLVVFDEAVWMPRGLWQAAEGLISNEDSRFLAIGNPEDPSSEFAEICKPGSDWNVERISAFDTPNFTGEPIPEYLQKGLVGPTWVAERKRSWGERSPMYIAKVLGAFPDRTSDGLIPWSAIHAAQERSLPTKGPDELGVDVGAGGDRNSVCRRRGSVARIIRRDNEPDTMVSCGNLLHDLKVTHSRVAKVDYIGIGRGMVDRAREQGSPVLGVNASWAARDPKAFANIRAETYWNLRERFVAGDIDLDPEDDDLASQLASLKYKRTSRGQIIIESKAEMKARGVASPDDADALMMSFLEPPAETTAPAFEVWS